MKLRPSKVVFANVIDYFIFYYAAPAEIGSFRKNETRFMFVVTNIPQLVNSSLVIIKILRTYIFKLQGHFFNK